MARARTGTRHCEAHCSRRSSFAGLRIGEAVALRWRDVDLAAGRLRDGVLQDRRGGAHVDRLPPPREALSIHKAVDPASARPDDFVFPTGARSPAGHRQRAAALPRSRAVEKAMRQPAQARRGAPALQGITPHSLRCNCYISLLLATGAEVPYVMRQVGHADPKVTLSIYAQVMYRGEGERERLKAIVEGAVWALSGTEEALSGGARAGRANDFGGCRKRIRCR